LGRRPILTWRGTRFMLRPDVLTLDIEMPRMDGLTFLRKLMRFHPMPVIAVSSIGRAETAMEALRCGSVEVSAKPGGPYSVGELRTDLAGRIRAAAARCAHRPSHARSTPGNRLRPVTLLRHAVVAIGASTGGTEAIEALLTRLPECPPPILIAQHIPPGFSRAFANR
jgi:two-component system, chemotaxis family, protein-glutamate methylesterase/glutaminase